MAGEGKQEADKAGRQANAEGMRSIRQAKSEHVKQPKEGQVVQAYQGRM
jgi:hypothetical protein